MAPVKLPKGKKATHPILVTKSQHSKIHAMAKRQKISVTALTDVMIEQAESYFAFSF